MTGASTVTAAAVRLMRVWRVSGQGFAQTGPLGRLFKGVLAGLPGGAGRCLLRHVGAALNLDQWHVRMLPFLLLLGHGPGSLARLPGLSLLPHCAAAPFFTRRSIVD